MILTEVESRTQGSRPRTPKKSEAKAKDQGHKRKCSPKGLHKNFSGDLKKKRSSKKFFKRSPRKNVFQKNFSSAPQNFNNSKNSVVLEPRTGQFSRTWGLEAKAKDFKMRPRGLHLWILTLNMLNVFFPWCSHNGQEKESDFFLIQLQASWSWCTISMTLYGQPVLRHC